SFLPGASPIKHNALMLETSPITTIERWIDNSQSSQDLRDDVNSGENINTVTS
ncbi:MAG: hypothetical protein GPJ54_09925, partial [Candidatus Heimdallarchaeota archaeon]|nr:hypothetical protein [Candidatus Heimdallarchaeota archaeon]